jgi:hypothetical protein
MKSIGNIGVAAVAIYRRGDRTTSCAAVVIARTIHPSPMISPETNNL